MQLRTQLTIATTIPAACAAASLVGSATAGTDGDGLVLLVVSVAFIVIAATAAWLIYLTDTVKQLDHRTVALRKRIKDLEARADAMEGLQTYLDARHLTVVREDSDHGQTTNTHRRVRQHPHQAGRA